MYSGDFLPQLLLFVLVLFVYHVWGALQPTSRKKRSPSRSSSAAHSDSNAVGPQEMNSPTHGAASSFSDDVAPSRFSGGGGDFGAGGASDSWRAGDFDGGDFGGSDSGGSDSGGGDSSGSSD